MPNIRETIQSRFDQPPIVSTGTKSAKGVDQLFVIWGYTELSADCVFNCDRISISFIRPTLYLRQLITLLSDIDLLKLGPIKSSVVVNRVAVRAACSFVLGNREKSGLQSDTFEKTDVRLMDIPT
ncbi:hypothetical protein N9189_02485 [Pirellulaceae bacterium]|jgi:hypothetical protein|nr:hypothetical protein [Pirellulaceae bacterium]